MGNDDISKESKASHLKLLTKDNYLSWKRDIKLLLQENNLHGFIDETGRGKKPDEKQPDTVKEKHEKHAVKSRAILINSISEKYRDAACTYTTTKDVWTHLASVFEPSTRS
uniref:Uncharacterized protein n=1 Tax=Strigamia maritima TaxID=126957 RepID=T1IGU1_STRMM